MQPSQSLLAARGKLEVPPLMRAQMQKAYNESQVGGGREERGCKVLISRRIKHVCNRSGVQPRRCGREVGRLALCRHAMPPAGR